MRGLVGCTGGSYNNVRRMLASMLKVYFNPHTCEFHCRLFRTQCSNSYHRSWISEVNKVVRKWGGALQVDLLCFNLQRDANTLYYHTQALKKPSTSCVSHTQTPGCVGTDWRVNKLHSRKVFYSHIHNQINASQNNSLQFLAQGYFGIRLEQSGIKWTTCYCYQLHHTEDWTYFYRVINMHSQPTSPAC